MNSIGTRNIIGIRKMTWRERLVAMAIHGLSMLWKKLELTMVNAMSGDITEMSGRAFCEMSSRAVSLVNAIEMRRGMAQPKTADRIPSATHTFIVSL
ncbi:MAG: hypothetical protein MJZ78_03895 [Bacteroidales bacterium]|nr:hypothetical protein [Bacteroidales bacterium]